MAILRKREIRELSDDGLSVRINELRLELSKERAQIAIGGSPVNPGRIREIKKTIARILTEKKRRSK